MKKLCTALATSLMAAGGIVAAPPPAMAQQGSVAEIIVYGTDPCPRSTEDQVVVCARRPESERYRIPSNMRSSGTPQQMESWARKAQSLQTVGSTGINSCSPVGPAGYTGCLQQVIKEARGERKQQADEENPPQ